MSKVTHCKQHFLHSGLGGVGGIQCCCTQAQDGEGLNPYGCRGMDEKRKYREFIHLIHLTNSCELYAVTGWGMQSVSSGPQNGVDEEAGKRGDKQMQKWQAVQRKCLGSPDAWNFIYISWNNNRMSTYKQKNQSSQNITSCASWEILIFTDS